MIKFYCLLIFSFCTSLAKAQNSDSESSLAYANETKIFLNDIFGQKLTSKKFILIDEPKFDCKLENSNTSFLSPLELKFIKAAIENPKITSWRNSTGLKVNFINTDSLNNIFKREFLRLHNGWDYFHIYLGERANGFSAPIFLRDYQYCLFYFEYFCDFKCAYGETALYKKHNGKWIKLSTICSWIS